MYQDGNHFAWLSAPGLSALSILHVRGPEAAAFLQARGYRAKLGSGAISANKPELNQTPVMPRHVWLKNEAGEALDEVMVAPEDGGFTLTCHGGPAVRAAFEAEMLAAGFEPVDAFELPLFGARTRYRRETLRLIAQAPSDEGVRFGLWALEHGEAALDAALANFAGLRELLARSEGVRHLFEPLRVHLWGPVNAGKSSLLNALCGEQLAATGEEPALTRDVIEGRLEHRGITIRIFDTPGELRGGSELEQRAFKEAREFCLPGDVVLNLVPPGAAMPREGLVVFSRADEAPARELRAQGFPVAVSVRWPQSLTRLKDELAALAAPRVSLESGEAFLLLAELRTDVQAVFQGTMKAGKLRTKWL